MKKILMTGAGMVGSQIIEILNREHGIRPVVADLFFDYDYLDTIISRESYVTEECDILDEKRVREIMQKHRIEGVIHTAAVLPMRVGHDPHPGFFKVNTWGTTNLIFSAIENGVSKFVMFSTNGVYQFRKYGVKETVKEDYPTGLNDTNTYGNSKATVEYLLRELTTLGKINGKIVRPGEIFGPVMNRGNDEPIYWKAMVDAAIKSELYELKDHPEHRLDWVYCIDVANVAVNVLLKESNHMEYHAASGTLTGIYDLKNTLDKLFPGNQVKLTNCTKGGWNFPLSTERVKHDFDYDPLYNLEKGIEDYHKWMLSTFSN